MLSSVLWTSKMQKIDSSLGKDIDKFMEDKDVNVASHDCYQLSWVSLLIIVTKEHEQHVYLSCVFIYMLNLGGNNWI